MVRSLIGILIAATVVGVSGAQPQQSQEQAEQPQQPSVFRSGSDVVRAYVTVTDKDGRIVTTLQKDDFEVRDGGKGQPIILFDHSPRAIRLIVMLDVSGSMQGNLPLLRNGTAQLVKYLRREDGARIGTFGKDVVISPSFTREPGELLAALPSSIDPEALTRSGAPLTRRSRRSVLLRTMRAALCWCSATARTAASPASATSSSPREM